MLNVTVKCAYEKPEDNFSTEMETETNVETVYRVFLFNDNHHTFDEVIIQLIKAINCSFNKARTFAFEVHVKGKSMVFAGSMQECLKVSSILEEIELHTQIVG